MSRRPAQFTELYFTDPAKIPKRLSMSNPNRFAFTIANHEGKALAYPYVVTAQSPKEASIISQHIVTVAPGGIVQETVQFTPDHPGTSYLVTVHMSGRSEIIHFLGKT